ncbi:FkbM family methyltransferase [Phenylobacterium sp.]|jgi:FkbM family methyltransferase|uniref:FkbM family methyltransferase n=1 Tax=Phenylobacterium sp. TaxID=1871053 RepID=UPI002F91CA60
MSEPDARQIQTVHGPMLALRGDQYVTRSLEVYGEFSGLEQRLFEQVVKPGMTVVEVGANIGAHTVPLARACAPGTLYVFEPQQRVFQILCANLALNDIRNVVALPEASGAEPGHVVVPEVDYGSDFNFGGLPVFKAKAGAPGRLTRLTPVDSLGLESCGFLKIDVEGFEPDVLRGARETILRCRPVLYVENDREANQQEVISLIDELGYDQYWHTPALFDPKNPNGVAENVFGPVVSVNLFCLPREAGHKAAGAKIDPQSWTCPVAVRSETPEHLAVDAEVAKALNEIEAGRYPEAEKQLRRLRKRYPDHNNVQHAFGALMHQLGKLEDAEAALRKAHELRPGSAESRVALGGVLLTKGEFAEGWPLFDYRHQMAHAGGRKPAQAFPEWKGEPVAGKHVLIWPEEGYGDQIQFARFAPWLARQGAEVSLICPPELFRLFDASLDGVRVLAAKGRVEMPDPDYWVMSASIPGRAGITLQTIPAEPYLKAPPALAQKGARIGLAVRGNPRHANDANRSLPPKLAERLMDLPGAVSLLPEDTGAADFADTAAIVASLDLVISVDTSVAHLAGALGKPVWILLPHIGTDWRWMRGRDDSPWYPTARLFRQSEQGGWAATVQAVLAAASREISG